MQYIQPATYQPQLALPDVLKNLSPEASQLLTVIGFAAVAVVGISIISRSG